MADERIDSFIAPAAFDELLKADQAISSIVKTILEANTQAVKAEGFSKQAKTIEDVAKAADKMAAANEKQRLGEIRLQQAREKAFDDYEKKLQKEILARQKLADAEAKSNAAAAESVRKQQEKAAVNALAEDSLKKLSQTLDKARDGYSKLTAAERENANIGGVVLNRIKELDAQLKATDASQGKFQRNVGNYAGALTGLGFSVRNIAGELPNLGISIRTFTQAISNNIGPLSDSIRQLREENKLLAAEGKTTTPIWKSVASSFFTVQTAILLAVAAATFLIDRFSKGNKAAQDAEKANQKYADSLKSIDENQRESANSDIAHAKILAALAADTQQTMAVRIKAVKELQATYPTTFGNLEKQAILEGNVAEAMKETTNQIFAKAAAQAAQEKFAASEKKAYDLTILQEDAQLKLNNALTTFNDINNAAGKNPQNQFARNAAVTAAKEVQKLQGELLKLNDAVSKSGAESARFLNDAQDNAAKAGDLFTSDGKKDPVVKVKDPVVKVKDPVVKVKDLTHAFEKLNEEIQKFFISLANPSKSELDQIQKEIDSASSTVEFDIFGKHSEEKAAANAKALFDILIKHRDDKLKITTDQEKKKAEILERANTLERSATAFVGELGNIQGAFAERRIAQLDREIDKINEKRTADINAIEASMLGEEEKRRRIAEINIASDAQEKKLAQEKIERQRRAAVFEKAITLSQIIADTALAVVRALGSKPYTPYNIALAAITAGIGAAKFAVAAATPIPQYEDGTQGAPHKGGPAVMFEGNKAEAVFEPGRAPWIGNRAGVYDLAPGSHVMSNKELLEVAKMYTVGMPALIPMSGRVNANSDLMKGLNDVKRAIENKPVSTASITNGGIHGFVFTGNYMQTFINNLKR